MIPTSRKILAIMPWNNCNFKCKHCANNSSPKTQQRLSISTVFDLISQAASIYDDDWCCSITGGEPLFFFDELLAICEHVKKHNGYTTLMSNGYWGKTKSQALSTAKELAAQNVLGVGFSFDIFHKEFVKKEWIGNALEACHSLGIETKIKCAASKDYRLTDAVRDLQDLSPWHTNFQEFPITPTGRAKANLPSEQFLYLEKLPKGKCKSTELVIGSDNNSYACCNGGGYNFKIGDITKHTYSELLYLHRTNLTLHYITKFPIARCISHLEREEQSDIINQAYVDECDLCDRIFSSQRNREIIQEHMESKLLSHENRFTLKASC